MDAFTVDGIVYHVFVPEGGIKRSGKILDGDKAGRVQTGGMERDIIGTYYNYAIEIDADRLSPEEYDALYDVLSAPVDYRTIAVPYGQGTIAFKAYITGVEDVLETMAGGVNRWGGLTASFVAMNPYRT